MFSVENAANYVCKRSASVQGPRALSQEKLGADNTKVFCYPQWYFCIPFFIRCPEERISPNQYCFSIGSDRQKNQ